MDNIVQTTTKKERYENPLLVLYYMFMITKPEQVLLILLRILYKLITLLN